MTYKHHKKVIDIVDMKMYIYQKNISSPYARNMRAFLNSLFQQNNNNQK